MITCNFVSAYAKLTRAVLTIPWEVYRQAVENNSFRISKLQCILLKTSMSELTFYLSVFTCLSVEEISVLLDHLESPSKDNRSHRKIIQPWVPLINLSWYILTCFICVIVYCTKYYMLSVFHLELYTFCS